MTNTGIFRKTDSLGRIVIPAELRKSLDIEIEAYLDIFLSNDVIILRKHQGSCIFCGRKDKLISYKEKNICTQCRDQLISAFDSKRE